MKKTLIAISIFLAMIIITSCGTEKLLEEAKTAVDAYNSAATKYNGEIGPYNQAVVQIESANTELQKALDAAQEIINKGEDPYDVSTLENLKTSLAEAGNAKVSVPSLLDEYEILSVSDDAKKNELKDVIEKATTGAEEIGTFIIPDVPAVPNYSGPITTVSDTLKAYEDSIQSLKQITAPSDEFVKQRLHRVDTITAMEGVTEDHDPNGHLNKQGGYIGCIYFTDSQVDRSELYIEDGEDNIIDIGTDGGGAVEIFATTDEATVRNTYLGSFDGMGSFSSGSHYVEGTCVIRTSNYLNGTQQKELTRKITEALIAID